jgi:hypothetical protein
MSGQVFTVQSGVLKADESGKDMPSSETECLGMPSQDVDDVPTNLITVQDGGQLLQVFTIL